ncbi:MAG: hypothetical protein KIS94_05605 [Chitinophagales bacterium]|nr:hypothetical protein [Chitinophagales bacterium]
MKKAVILFVILIIILLLIALAKKNQQPASNSSNSGDKPVKNGDDTISTENYPNAVTLANNPNSPHITLFVVQPTHGNNDPLSFHNYMPTKQITYP